MSLRPIGEHVHKCDECSKYYTKIGLIQHKRCIHTTKTIYNCGFCGNTYYCKAGLKQHVKTCSEARKHIKDGTISFCCNNNPKDKVKLTIYEFECDICHHKFKQKGNMDQHRLKKHKISLPTTIQTRNKLRNKVQIDRFNLYKTNLKGTKKWGIYDNDNNILLSSYTDEKPDIFTKDICKKMVDNCNKIFGLYYLFNTDDTIVKNSELYKECFKEWGTYESSIKSLVADRPNQESIIIDIIKEYRGYM